MPISRPRFTLPPVVFALLLPLACGGADDVDDGAGTTAAMTEGTSEPTVGPGTEPGTMTSSNDSTAADTAADTTAAGTTAAEDDTSATATADTSDSGGSAGVQPPVLMQIAWEHAQPCQNPQEREVTVTVTVEDPDTPPSDLAFSGGIAGCDGEIDAAVSVLVCSGASNHVGAVTVTDPQGGSTDGAFNVIVCVDGTADF
jgi:hypothetical protein